MLSLAAAMAAVLSASTVTFPSNVSHSIERIDGIKVDEKSKFDATINMGRGNVSTAMSYITALNSIGMQR